MTDLATAYREYKALGFSPIPLAERSKEPLVKWQEFQHRQPTESEIDDWLRAWPRANIALVMGGTRTFAVDIDGDYPSAIGVLAAKGIDIPSDAPRQATAKGKHLIFSTDRPIKDAVGWLTGDWFSIDIRGPGYIAVYPSVHPSGFEYAWEYPIHANPPIAPLALREAVERSPERPGPGLYVPETDDWVARLMSEGVPEGGRDVAGTRLAGYFFNIMPEDIATRTMLQWNRDQCQPPMSEHQVLKICHSIAKRAGPPLSPTPGELRVQVKDVSSARSAGEILLGSVSDVRERTEFFEFPYRQMNTLLFGGMTRTEYMILSGRPSLGKTALALDVAEYAAKHGMRVLFVSLEMSSQALAQRLAGRISGIPAGMLRAGGLTEDEYDRYVKAVAVLGALPVIIEGGLTRADQIYHLVEYAAPRYDAVIVDYLQLLQPIVARRENHRLEVDQSSETLKAIAKHLHVPVIAISSLNQMGQLKESSALEYAADIIASITATEFEPGRRLVRVSKARSASIGEVHLMFDGANQTFTETTAIEYGRPF